MGFLNEAIVSTDWSSSSSSELKQQKWKKVAEVENFHFCGIDSPKKAVLDLNYTFVFLDSGKLHTALLLIFWGIFGPKNVAIRNLILEQTGATHVHGQGNSHGQVSAHIQFKFMAKSVSTAKSTSMAKSTTMSKCTSMAWFMSTAVFVY